MPENDAGDYQFADLDAIDAATVAAMMSADFSAGVIEIERPGVGDVLRRPRLAQDSEAAANHMRQLDAEPEVAQGHEIPCKLVATAPSFVPGALRRRRRCASTVAPTDAACYSTWCATAHCWQAVRRPGRSPSCCKRTLRCARQMRRTGTRCHLVPESIAARGSSDWMARFDAAQVPVSRIAVVEEKPTDMQALDKDMATAPAEPGMGVPLLVRHPVQATSVPHVEPRSPPGLGEHSRKS